MQLDTHAQSCNWANSIGNAIGTDQVKGMAIDASGNVYITGYFEGTADFDPGSGTDTLTSVGGQDIFLAKYDQNGTYLWALGFGSSGNDQGYEIALDTNSNVYLTGGFTSTVDFDPDTSIFNLVSSGAQDVFFAKYTASGSFVFAKKAGGSNTEFAYSITLDNTGNILIAGQHSGTTDFDPGPGTTNLTAAYTHLFFAKYDASGNYIWARSIGSITWNSFASAFRIRCDINNDIVITGKFNNTADFDPGPSTASLNGAWSASTMGIYFAKYTSSGDYIMAKSIPGTGTPMGSYGLDLDAYGNIFISGSFGFDADFDPGPGTATLVGQGGTPIIFLAKYGSTGNYIYAKRFGEGESTNLVAVPTGEVYMTGWFRNSVDFDPGINTSLLIASNGKTDVFLAKYDMNGNHLWSFDAGDSEDDMGFTIDRDGSNNLFLGGIFRGTSDFSPDTNIISLSSGNLTNPDAFFGKYGDCATLSFTGNISGADTICAGIPFAYSVSPVPGAINYTWILPSGWTGSSSSNTILVTPNTQSGTISVYANDSCGSGIPASLGITVKTVPNQPGPVTGNTSVCSGSILTYSVSPVPGATSYTWTLPAGWSGTSLSDTITVTVGNNGGMITVAANNTCGTGLTSTLNVTVTNPPQQPSMISGINTICENSAQTYSVTADPLSTSYQWTLPPGWSGSSFSSVITATAGSQGGTLSVIAINTCGSSPPRSLIIQVDPLPIVSGNNFQLCSGTCDTLSLNVSGSPPFTYSWSPATGLNNVTSSTPISCISSSVTYTVVVTDINGCQNNAMDSVTVLPIPPVTLFLSGNNLCIGDTVNISVSGAVSFTWSPATGLSSTTGNNVTASPLASTSYTVTGTDTAGCENADSVTVTVFQNPPAPTITFNGTELVSSALTGNQWYFNDTLIPGALGQNYSPLQNGNYTVEVTDGNGCTAVSAPYSLFSTGQVFFDQSTQIIISPNPNFGRFTVYSPAFTMAFIIDDTGKTVQWLEPLTTAGKIGVSIEEFPDGIYSLVICFSSGITVKKFIKISTNH